MAPLHIAAKKENIDIIQCLFSCENLDYNIHNILIVYYFFNNVIH